MDKNLSRSVEMIQMSLTKKNLILFNLTPPTHLN